MNEQIRKLAEQAGIEFDDDFPLEPETIYYLKLSDFEKFAELIIRECVGLINEQLQHNNPNDSILALKIKEHFGVEE